MCLGTRVNVCLRVVWLVDTFLVGLLVFCSCPQVQLSSLQHICAILAAGELVSATWYLPDPGVSVSAHHCSLAADRVL